MARDPSLRRGAACRSSLVTPLRPCCGRPPGTQTLDEETKLYEVGGPARRGRRAAGAQACIRLACIAGTAPDRGPGQCAGQLSPRPPAPAPHRPRLPSAPASSAAASARRSDRWRAAWAQALQQRLPDTSRPPALARAGVRAWQRRRACKERQQARWGRARLPLHALAGRKRAAAVAAASCKRPELRHGQGCGRPPCMAVARKRDAPGRGRERAPLRRWCCL